MEDLRDRLSDDEPCGDVVGVAGVPLPCCVELPADPCAAATRNVTCQLHGDPPSTDPPLEGWRGWCCAERTCGGNPPDHRERRDWTQNLPRRRLFGPDSVTWRAHLEPVLWVSGFRALLLQSLHPRVIRATYQNSALFDPRWAGSRFQRTVEFVGVRTFGSTADVERAAARVRRLHAALHGYDPDTGETFRIDEPPYLLGALR